MIKHLSNDLKRAREHYTELGKIIEELEAKVKVFKTEEEEADRGEEEEETLKKYIKSEWGTCKQAREKIEYPEYCHNCMDISWVTFSRFVRSNDCYCGECEK